MRPRPATRLLFALAVASAALAAVVAVAGGFTMRVGGIRVSVHGAIRPLLLSLLTGALAMRRLPGAERDRLVERSSRAATRVAPWCAAALAAVAFAVAAEYGTRSAGGSDTYGYVSQSRLWLRGDLHVRQDFASRVPWPNGEWTFSPLGYRPADDHTIVPTYAAGLPILMAAFARIGGACGPFLVTPLCAGLLVLLTYLLGTRLSGPATGLAAALIAATSPTVVFMSLWSMSDVPAAAFWTAALVSAAWPNGYASAVWAGFASGAAIAVRPNLAPVSIIVAGLVVGAARGGRLQRALIFAMAAAPFIAFVAVLNHRLYGGVLESGYGDTASLFSAANLGVNLAQFSRWSWDTQGPLVFLFLLAPLVRWGQTPPTELRGQTPRVVGESDETQSLVVSSGQTPPRWGQTPALLAFVIAVFGCYAFYTPFHAWWFLRFLLPAFPVAFVLAADAVWVASRRFGVKGRAVAMLVFTLACVDWGVRFAKSQYILDLGNGEQKFADVGRFVAAELPPQAVIIALLHSGSIRYYSGRSTLRYDWLDADWLDRAVEYLQRNGSEPYLLLERGEIGEFREKFKGQRAIAALDRPPIATHTRGVSLYAIDASRIPAAPRVIPRTAGCE